MKVNKILLISMVVLLLCCITAVSATDVNGTDVSGDDIVIDEISSDISEVEIDEVEDDPVDEEINPVTTGTINGQPWETYINNYTGYLKTEDDLNFSGEFHEQIFGNFKIDRNIKINAENATFYNIGFDLWVSQLTLNGGTFIINESATINSVVLDLGSGNVINNTIMDITAPENRDFYAINLVQPNGAQILNNNITYRANHANINNYNYVVRVYHGSNVKMIKNNITAYLPLKDVHYPPYNGTLDPNIEYDLVAGVAVEQSSNFLFDNNLLNVTGSLRGGDYPTLDALIIVKSDNSNITNNRIYERDNATGQNESNFLYAVDVYRCNYMLIDYNVIELNTFGGNITINGTGAAYGIQITGPQFITTISNNNRNCPVIKIFHRA